MHVALRMSFETPNDKGILRFSVGDFLSAGLRLKHIPEKPA